ncbi:hypothetical protein [Nereida sp. MMG025]|uniref:hypothetical protein n=1 Tax=Nereida sp. MMG025 TaxID=2909981 RepID=UPI001F34654B|nr:hypothetical protein [Nereida sp. MMG025]MCF6445150.1 hypothetical protein [Nereida sp. MMG025]
MPQLIRVYIQQCLIGFGISAVFVALLLAFDVKGLWTLISNSPDGVLAVIMLFMMNGIVFAGVQFGIHIMLMAGKDEDDHDRDGRGPLIPIALPVRSKSDTPLDRAMKRNA